MAGLDFSAYSAGFAQSLQFLTYFFWALVFAAGAFFIYWYLQYKIPVTLHRVLGDGTVKELNLKAKLLKKTNELKLRKFKKPVNNPPPDFYLSTGKKDKIYFRWDGADLFVPQKVKYNSPLMFTTGDYNIRTQMGMRVRQAEERHGKKGFWQEFGQVIMWSSFIIITAVTMWIMFAKLELVADSISQLASAVKTTAQVVQ